MSPRGRAKDADEKRRERGERILAAAAALIQRDGYDRTSVDDVAREAGVAKGTIYLHWASREELFLAVLQRERDAVRADVSARLAAAGSEPGLRALLRHSALALMARPLMKAVLLRDTELIGRLANVEAAVRLRVERIANFHAYLQALRDRGLVRTDLSLDEQVYLVSGVFLGFFLVAPLIPPTLSVPDARVAELLAETVHRALAPLPQTAGGTEDAGTDALAEYLARPRPRLRTADEEDG